MKLNSRIISSVTLLISCILVAVAWSKPASWHLLGMIGMAGILLSLVKLLINNLGTAASAAFFIGLAFLSTFLVWLISQILVYAHPYWYLAIAAGIGTIGVPMLIENVFLRLLENTRIGAVARVTYYEAILHPFTLIVLVVAMLFIFVMCFVPFYTFNEETKFYRELGSSIALLASLVVMVFGSAKVIDEEIESRTMLTLMSKPIGRWQVIIGKYVGVVALIFVVAATLGLLGSICTYMRYFDDQRIDLNISGSEGEFKRLLFENLKSALAFAPLMVMAFLQVITLAAVSVAISTRYGLAINVTIISLLYVLANLARLIPDAQGIPEPLRSITVYLSYFFPYLGNFDITQLLVYRDFTLAPVDVPRPNLFSFGAIWGYVAMAAVYAGLYITASLGVATAMFRTRELN